MKKSKSLYLFLLSFILGPLIPTVLAQKTTPPILNEEILKRIQNEVSGSMCFEYVRYLSTLDREEGSKGYHQAAQYVIEKSEAYGLKEAVIEKYPPRRDEKGLWKYVQSTRYLWDCRGGELRLVKPYPMLISDYESATCTVAGGSHSANLEAEVVFINNGRSEDDYKGKDVRGKIVLSEWALQELAVHKFGALGTIHFSNMARFPEEDEAIRNFPIFSADETKEQTFGFNLSRTKGLFLKSLLDKGEKVVVSCKIDAEPVKDGFYELATAVIPGSTHPEEEFIFFAHLDHPKPGAHDNGSGDAALLEIARTLSNLIQRNIIPPPQRTIRFMWVPHMCGLDMYFLRHPEKIGKVKGGCNLDCVGANPVKYPLKFFVAFPPYSLPTYLTDIANNLVDHLNQKITNGIGVGPEEDLLFTPEGSRNMFSVTATHFIGMSDEELVSTWPLSIPALLFHDDPMPPRHSQLNFLDYIDATNLRRIAYLGAIISYSFASAGDEMAPGLLNEILYRGKNRLDLDLLKAKRLLEESNRENLHQNFVKGTNLLRWGQKREKGMFDSLAEIISNRKDLNILFSDDTRLLEENSQSCLRQLTKYYEYKCRNLDVQPLKKFPTERETSWAKEIPVHNPEMKVFPGCFRNHLYFEEKLGFPGYFVDYLRFLEKLKSGDSSAEKYRGLVEVFRVRNTAILESFNLIDGQNTIADIYDVLEAESWSGDYKSPLNPLTFEEMSKYFQLLKDVQIIDFKKK